MDSERRENEGGEGSKMSDMEGVKDLLGGDGRPIITLCP